MNKQAPSVGRILVMVGFALSCFGLLLFLWVAFGGSTPLRSKGYRFSTSFGEATQLAQEADVRISGVSVGKVKTIEPDKLSGRSRAVIQLEPQYAPLPKDARAILRQKTLLGETYVELSPGHPSAGLIPENGSLPGSRVSDTVELDEIFRTFDEPTRRAFERWMQNQALAVRGRGHDINSALGNLSSFAEDTNVLLRLLNAQEEPVRRLVRNTGVVFDALSERRGQLRGLIQNSERVFDTTARRNRELQETFIALPAFERESAATVRRLTKFAKDTDPLIDQLRPAARQLSPTLRDLSALAPDLKALFRDLDPLITVSKKGLPATEKFLDELHPLLGEFDPVLRQVNPILSFLGLYKREIGSFFANTVASTQASNIPPGGGVNTKVHYLRTTNPLNAENLAAYPTRLPTNRTNAYTFPNHFDNLKDGLPSYEDRQCRNGAVPHLGGASDQLLGLLPGDLGKQLTTLLGAGLSSTVAPPCKLQGDYTLNGKTTHYPQLSASSGAVARAAAAEAVRRSRTAHAASVAAHRSGADR